MSEKKYISHIDKPTVYTTSNGGRYVRPFDILRSKGGRAVLKSHSNETTKSETKSTSLNDSDLKTK